MANYSQAGYALGQAQQNTVAYQDPPPAPSRLSSIAGHFESLNGELNVSIERCVRLADRLTGSVPQEVGKDGNTLRGTGGGLATALENHVEHCASLLSRLRSVLERLETL